VIKAKASCFQHTKQPGRAKLVLGAMQNVKLEAGSNGDLLSDGIGLSCCHTSRSRRNNDKAKNLEAKPPLGMYGPLLGRQRTHKYMAKRISLTRWRLLILQNCGTPKLMERWG